MCKLGDIIVIKKFKNENGDVIPKHSFVVINDEKNFLEGLKYDFVANMMCSFHDDKHKRKKIKFLENLPVEEKLISGEKINSKQGYIKADQLYYFNKNIIKYKKIAHIDDELLDDLIQLIFVLDKKDKLKNISTNLCD